MSAERSSSRNWADGWAAPALLVALAAAVFARSLPGGFVWDDHRFIDENPSVLAPTSWVRFLTDPTTVDTAGARGIVRPLRTLEFAADHALFGLDPTAFRVHSLLWHAAGAVLALLVFRRLLGDARAAFAAAAFWAVHPAQCESVAFVSSRGDLAMGACSMAAVLCALRSKGFDRDLAISLAAALVAPLYKETGVAIFLVVAVLRWTKLSRAPVWPYVLASAAYLVYRSAVQVGPIDHGAGFVLGGSTVGTFATMMRAFGYYVVQTLLPAQSLDWHMFPSTSFAEPGVLLWVVLHLAAVVSAVRARTSFPLWTVAVAWFYGFLLPVANWPVFLGMPSNERFLYLPLAGVALAFGCATVAAPRRLRLASAAVVAALAFLTVVRLGMWLGDDVLWPAVRADHDSPRAIEQYARMLRLEALDLRDEALRMPEGGQRSEKTAAAKARFEESLAQAHKAIDLWTHYELSNHPKHHFMRGPELDASSDCYILGRDEEALFHAEEAIRIMDGTDRFGHYDRAMPLLELGFAPQAIESMRRAVALGYPMPDAEIGGFFARAAARCEEDGLFSAAQDGYEAAARALPEGDARSAALLHLGALRSRPRDEAAETAERRRIAELDERLARLPRRCPVRRPVTVPE